MMFHPEPAEVTDEMVEQWCNCHRTELQDAKLGELETIIEWFPIISFQAND